jgi:hypothetical protein
MTATAIDTTENPRFRECRLDGVENPLLPDATLPTLPKLLVLPKPCVLDIATNNSRGGVGVTGVTAPPYRNEDGSGMSYSEYVNHPRHDSSKVHTVSCTIKNGRCIKGLETIPAAISMPNMAMIK